MYVCETNNQVGPTRYLRPVSEMSVLEYDFKHTGNRLLSQQELTEWERKSCKFASDTARKFDIPKITG